MIDQEKFYVVWEGRHTGIFRTWSQCFQSVDGYQGAKYRKCFSFDEAVELFNQGAPANYYTPKALKETIASNEVSSNPIISQPKLPVPDKRSAPFTALCIYTALDPKGNRWIYSFVWTSLEEGGRPVREFTASCSLPGMTKDLADFDALVQGLQHIQNHEYKYPLFTESQFAYDFAKDHFLNLGTTSYDMTEQLKVNNPAVYQYLQEKIDWLAYQICLNTVKNWDDKKWGPNPAKVNYENFYMPKLP